MNLATTLGDVILTLLPATLATTPGALVLTCEELVGPGPEA